LPPDEFAPIAAGIAAPITAGIVGLSGGPSTQQPRTLIDQGSADSPRSTRGICAMIACAAAAP
jgi:hypothetical protein